MALPKKYKKMVPLYTYRIGWDNEDKIFVVSVEELSGCMSHGKDPSEALKMGHEAVMGYLESKHKHKEEICLPISLQEFRGEFLVRATPDLHKKLAMEAKAAGVKTFNKYVIQKLRT